MKKLLVALLLVCTSYKLYCSATGSTTAPLNTSPEIQVQPEGPKTPRIGVLHLTGNLDMKTTMKNLLIASRDTSINGLILCINHNGGQGAPYSALHDLIKAVGTKKPIISLVIGYANSAGYLLTSAAHYIIAASGAELGSLGTYWEIHKYHDVMVKKDGIEANDTIEVFTAGKYKGIEKSCSKPLTQEMRAYLQQLVDTLNKNFMARIASNRNLSLDNQNEWGNAQEFIASEALRLGLVDKIGTIFDAEEKMIEFLKLRKPNINWAQQAEFVELESELPKK